MTHYKPLDELWYANLEATQRMEALALEAGATALRMQMDAVSESIPNSSERLRALLTTTAAERYLLDRFVTCSDIVKRTMEATRIWAEAAVEAQNQISRIAGAQSPATGPSLIAAWLSAARAGQEVSAVTERHHHRIAEGPSPNAA